MSRSHALLVVAVLAQAAPAAAHDQWGTVEQAHVCEKECAQYVQDSRSFRYTDAVKAGKVSAACKAEVERRGPLCLKDQSEQYGLNDDSVTHGDKPGYCAREAFGDICDQMVNDEAAKKAKADQAKKVEEENAKFAAEVAARDVPKPGMHDAKLEKAVATAFKPAYPDSKILKVVIDGWRDDLKKDDFGRVVGRLLAAYVVVKDTDGKCRIQNELWLQRGNGRSFSGPLKIEGGGASGDEILCSKAEAAAKGK